MEATGAQGSQDVMLKIHDVSDVMFITIYVYIYIYMHATAHESVCVYLYSTTLNSKVANACERLQGMTHYKPELT